MHIWCHIKIIWHNVNYGHFYHKGQPFQVQEYGCLCEEWQKYRSAKNTVYELAHQYYVKLWTKHILVRFLPTSFVFKLYWLTALEDPLPYSDLAQLFILWLLYLMEMRRDCCWISIAPYKPIYIIPKKLKNVTHTG